MTRTPTCRCLGGSTHATDDPAVRRCDLCGGAVPTDPATGEYVGNPTSTQTTDDFLEAERLRGSLRQVTDMLAELLAAGRFPPKGRSRDDKDSAQGWWEDRVGAIQKAYSVLAGEEDVLAWATAHPGLYVPPPGPVRLDR